MSRFEWSFKFFSKEGVKFLALELVIVFLGVYGAFLFQNYSENQRIRSEQNKILIGLKEDLEYFRIFFPGYAGDDQVKEWRVLFQEGEYPQYFEWRFIQPQYDYRAIEYALEADARVIDYELNSGIAEVYQELKKLEYVEDLITQIAMEYHYLPGDLKEKSEGELLHQQNFLNFKLFTERMADRSGIMNRIAEMSDLFLPEINAQFGKKELKNLELQLIDKYLNPENEAVLDASIPPLLEFFPNLTEEEIRNFVRIKGS